ncbi:MAG TPA: hypothetical protein VMU50_13355, partial [Polyangia bacterium]|nr:hypothetical protein [Polyangia bacterium]
MTNTNNDNDNASETGIETTPMAARAAFQPRAFQGGCACGAVRYQAVIDFSAGTSRCNCTLCGKAGLWTTAVRPAAFTLVSGADNLIDFQRGGRFSHFPFCKTCGV